MARCSPNGESVKPGSRAAPQPQQGFTYLAILFAVAFLGIALAAIGTVWSTAARRDREQQLLFAGAAYRSAIRSYFHAGRSYPQELQDLIEDSRNGVIRRHLRRLYADPMTGQADWQLMRNPAGGIFGVASTSTQVPIKQENFPPELEAFTDAKCYCDWQFK